ncbi:MAG: glycerol-3-phosphate dehydrogenase [Gemmatimonadota bacterium]
MTSRRADLSQLTAQPADLLVIGGGITGAGIARDAAMRGLRTILVEQHDLGWGTSSRSSRLIHGGLRYLEHGQLRLVFEASRERNILLSIAPHLVRPLPFIFPVHRRSRLFYWRLTVGMWLYDILSLFRNVRWHRMLGKRGVLRAEPLLRAMDLVGGARYYDAQCDDARLVLANARSAIQHGALVSNYMRVEQLEVVDGRVRGARIEDRLTGEQGRIRATTVVNATGPWCDRIRRLEFPHAAPLLRPTKGAHILVPRGRLGNHEALTITSPIDQRVMFILPWGDLSIVGTTDTDTTVSPEFVKADQDDVLYLIRSANAYFPNARLSEDDVVATYAGLRPLLAPEDERSASDVSREHRIVQGPNGMWTIAGGKLTTYRCMAAELVTEVVKELRKSFGRPQYPESRTDLEPLPGGESEDLDTFMRAGADLGLTPATTQHLLSHFGTESPAIFNLAREHRELLEPLHPDHAAIRAEIVHIVRRELAQTLEDVLVRRTHLFYETTDHGLAAAEEIASLMGAELGWSSEKRAAEVERYRAYVIDARSALSSAGTD